MTVSRVTIRDVAAQSGVSRTTVSLVLNDVPGANISFQRMLYHEAGTRLGEDIEELLPEKTGGWRPAGDLRGR